MSPISDIGAFRTGRWRLEWFLKAVRLGVEWAIEHRAAYDFLGHPSCLYVTDPEFRAIDLICDLVRKAGDRAAIVGLDTLARAGSITRRHLRSNPSRDAGDHRSRHSSCSSWHAMSMTTVDARMRMSSSPSAISTP